MKYHSRFHPVTFSAVVKSIKGIVAVGVSVRYKPSLKMSVSDHSVQQGVQRTVCNCFYPISFPAKETFSISLFSTLATKETTKEFAKVPFYNRKIITTLPLTHM